MAQYTKTYTFSNGTTADGGQVDTEITALGTSVNNITNAQIDSAAAIAISKTALGTYTAWTDYNPTWYKSDNTATFTWTTDSLRYTQVGKTVTVQFYVATASAAPGFNLYLTAPVTFGTGVYNADDTVLGYCKFTGTGFNASTGTPGFVNYNTSAGRIRLNPFTAITIGTDAVVSGTFSYEVA